jgi:hypothetical protein
LVVRFETLAVKPVATIELYELVVVILGTDRALFAPA